MGKIRIIQKNEKKVNVILFIIIIICVVLSTLYTQFNIFELIGNFDAFTSFLVDDFLPPAILTGEATTEVLKSILVTIAMAIVSTTLAGICAFFVSLFGSEYVSITPRLAKYIRAVATFMRNIPALVWAFILFSSLGIGTGVGVVALFVTSFAFMVRAFIETIDEVSQDCIESLEVVGASFWQRVFQGILPACIGGFISWFLYCFEVNIRSSTIVGMVGGGGVGLVLFSYLKGFQYNIAASIILVIALMVILVDLLTGILRKKLVNN